MKKIVTVVGARPQFIKMALVSQALGKRRIKEIVVHTGQHYDNDMSDIFFKEFRIANPRYNLKIGSGSRAGQLAAMVSGIEKILMREKPRLVMVYGDTNSTIAGAIAASGLGIQIAHVEAGLRCFDKSMPEEVNRIVTDSLSDIFFCPTSTAVSNLKKEGKTKGVHLVGDVMYDMIRSQRRSLMAGGPARGRYILCTIHRAENADRPKNLKNIFKALGSLKEDVVLPLHPRTRKNIKKYGIHVPENVKLTAPASYNDMLILEAGAAAIVTDSGGVQKEALILGVPCITLRDRTEWVETVKAGANRLVGVDPKKIVSAVAALNARNRQPDPEFFYGNGYAHEKIASILDSVLKG